MQYLVVIEQGASGFGAYVPDLPGCVAAGQSRAEVAALIHEAIQFHIEGMKEEGLPIPEPHSSGELVEARVQASMRMRSTVGRTRVFLDPQLSKWLEPDCREGGDRKVLCSPAPIINHPLAKETCHVLSQCSTSPRASHQTREGLSRIPGARSDEQMDTALRIHLPGASHGRQGRRYVPNVIQELLLRQ